MNKTPASTPPKREWTLTVTATAFPEPGNIYSATPKDLCLFLIHKDRAGKTQVHSENCMHMGEGGCFQCGCPMRLAAKTVDSLIGKLRSILNNVGRGRDWDSRFLAGNPAASPVIKNYVKLMKEEQAKAGVKPKQAVPIFMDKLVQLLYRLQKKMQCSSYTPLQRFLYARDQSYFKLDLFSGDRPSDLGLTRTQDIIRFPNDDGLIFNHCF